MSEPLINPKDIAENLAPEAQDEFEELLYARHVEVDSWADLEKQRGTPVPAIFNQMYKFIQNPSSVSVETFKRMVDTDDTIGSGVDFLVTCLVARMGRYQHKNDEISEWVNNALEKIQGGWVPFLKEFFSATWCGYYVGEKVWRNDEQFGFIVDKIIPLPPTTVLFEIERSGEITKDGILQYQRSFNPYFMGSGFFGGVGPTGSGWSVATPRPDIYAKLGDMPFPIRTANSWAYLTIRIPRQKCIHYAFDAQGKFGNPYGRSLLRRIYKYYVMKDAFLQMLAVALDRKGTPLPVVYSDGMTMLGDPEALVNGQIDPTKKGIRADIAAKKAFTNLHNDSVIYLPGKKGEIYEVDFMPQASNASDFIQALDFCNKSMVRGLLIPALIFSSGDGSGSYALGEAHASTFDKILDGMNQGAQDILLQEMVYEMLMYNFPKEMWEKDGLGSFSKRDLTHDEIQKIAATYTSGIADGYIDNQDLKDLNKMRETAGFEPRTKPIEKVDPFGMGGMPGEEVPNGKSKPEPDKE